MVLVCKIESVRNWTNCQNTWQFWTYCQLGNGCHVGNSFYDLGGCRNFYRVINRFFTGEFWDYFLMLIFTLTFIL